MMPSYVIYGSDHYSAMNGRIVFPSPPYIVIGREIPQDNGEYTLVLSGNWYTSPIMKNLSLIPFILRARMVETNVLHPLRSIYSGKSITACSHISLIGQTSIISSKSDYFFLCPHCVALYAINGLPSMEEVLSPLGFSTDFPSTLKGE